ncbi:HTH-type transcriptional regulator MalT [Paraburkholderia caffeinitolerans]|uniref:HTH-type transcriptional regulator MalT n=1 Tax=Paraburkholderia caffeinitolerans TaxID=1723730 RepID=A0A6J5H3I2_9BURK|nr:MULTISPECIES: LuxR C-terminal-related transcriptional regulator [Paraburkholderia]CAB3810003.1 HTH-type transcriptional regulator MalT [Paraburkholderia caffeinitolerans]
MPSSVSPSAPPSVPSPASSTPDAGRAASEFVLKTVAPREPAHLFTRARLGAANAGLRECQAVLVQAPAGFGKTSLLALWRREYLSRGTAVAWFSADERDETQRLVPGLVQAVRTACARPAFARHLTDGAAGAAHELEGVTAWLAEVAQLSFELVLIVDEAERLPASGVRALVYILHNAPPNLRTAVAARHGLDVPLADLLAYGQCARVDADALRLRIDETIALAAARFGERMDADAGARLFELCEGWPLGLQLALAAMERASDPRQIVEPLEGASGELRERLLQALIARLAPADVDFLTRISVVDTLHPALCAALTGEPEAAGQLARLARDTPMFTAADGNEWLQLHALVRDVLRARLAQWPTPQQTELHARAAAWLAAQGMTEPAARHAHAAGQHRLAFELAERSLLDAVRQGHLPAMLEWLELLPEAELEARPRLRLAAAWALALGERHPEAARQIEHVLAGPNVDDELRYECVLILSAAAVFADDIDRCVALFEPWVDAAPATHPWLAQMHANRLGARALALGEPAQARQYQQRVPPQTQTQTPNPARQSYVGRWGAFVVGFSYFHEGQLQLAETVLMPALASADADLGRRHPLSCMLAALCATLAYEADRIDEAAALLANRLDVLERSGTPDTVMLAWRTAARVAVARGAEHRALDLLESLHALGVTRRLPRLSMASLAEQVRMHANCYRVQTCEALVQRIDELARADADAASQRPLWRRHVLLMQAHAQASAAIAARRWQPALDALNEAAQLADAMKRRCDGIEIMALRAYVLEQTGAEGRALLLEAVDLAQTFRLSRTLSDLHPAVADWARRTLETSPGAPARNANPIAAPRVVRAAPQTRAVSGVILTPKEREILELLARALSNKEIALALGVGEVTVKWHLKNLFGKLDASSRKHAVRRALMLGLLEAAD